MRTVSIAAAAVAWGLGGASPLANAPRQQVCNGYAEFCDRIYSNVSLVGAHDSAFVGSILDPRVNQEVNVTGQLEAGIRLFEAQTHTLDGVLSMCHSSCLELYAGSLATYLTTILTWLEANPDNVVTLLLSNGDYNNVTMFGDVFSETGLAAYAYVPPTTPNQLPMADWPTYAELIGNGTKIVVFMDYDADQDEVPYIMDWFTYFFETPYDTTNATFPECSIAYPPDGSPDGRMYVVNHFLDLDILSIDIPDNAADYTTNAATGSGSIGAQNALCYSIYGREPNFVLVDMFDRGDVFTAQDNMNNIS